MKLVLVCIALFITTGSLAQKAEAGIQFEQKLSWEQIKEKARQENKFIFIDCYTTWCGYCKKMDAEVYPLEKVGDYFNRQFVSVRLQMDTAKADDEEVKSHYADAHNILSAYKVNAFPSFLFFSSEGKLVHRAVGYRGADDFLVVAAAATDPSKQYYTLLEKYRKGFKDYAGMGDLAKSAKYFGEQEMADTIARDYKKNYLDKLMDDQLCTKENLDFVAFQFPQLIYQDGSPGKFFRLFYTEQARVDSVLNWKGIAQMYASNIIRKEEIDDKIWQDEKPVTSDPDWKTIRETIRRKYNSYYATAIVTKAQLDFYKKIKNWNKYAVIIDDIMKQHAPKVGGKEFMNAVGAIFDDLWALNSVCWEVFTNCNDKIVLKKALAWCELSLKLQMDEKVQWVGPTVNIKANLLYKLGRVKEAVRMEDDLIRKHEDMVSKEKGGDAFRSEYREVVNKMRTGVSTWHDK